MPELVAWFQSLRGKSRYVSFLLTIVLLYTDMASRLGISMALIGGMVKEDCNDTADKGEYCWSEAIQANMVGAYFYGYALQFAPTIAAGKIGFNRVLRGSTLISALIQITFPMVVDFSPILGIALQGLRGFVAGIYMSNTMSCAQTWGIGDEGRKFISAVGIVSYLGLGSGPFVVGLLTEHVGWRYFFYLNGASFLVVLLLMMFLMPDDPLESRIMTEAEKLLFRKKQQIKSVTKNPSESVLGNLKLVLSRVYVWGFCVYLFANNYVFCTMMQTTPFYLDKILKASTSFISYLQLSLALVSAFTSYAWGYIFPKLDKLFPWLYCKMGFLVGPMIVRGAVCCILPYTNSLSIDVVLLVLSMVSFGTQFSGSIMTVNYELDPANSALILGIMNSIGQTTGFINPLLMAAMTGIDKGVEDYEAVFKARWSYFYLLNTGLCVLASLTVVGAYFVRPSEWQKHHSLQGKDKGDKDAEVIVNKLVLRGPEELDKC